MLCARVTRRLVALVFAVPILVVLSFSLHASRPAQSHQVHPAGSHLAASASVAPATLSAPCPDSARHHSGPVPHPYDPVFASAADVLVEPTGSRLHHDDPDICVIGHYRVGLGSRAPPGT